MKKPGKKNLIIIISTTVVILAIAAFSFITGNNAVSNFIGTVTSPVQKVVSIAINATGDFFSDIFNSGNNAKENKELEEKVLMLESQIRMLEGYKAENENLRSVIELKDSRTDLNLTGANVIGRDSSEFHSIITIDKGSADGIKVNSVVLVPQGLIGEVYEVGYNYAKVKTVFDTECAVSAVCPRSGDLGIVEATSSNGTCVMNYIDKSAKIVVGDMIETSGTGGTYPEGILIGKVTEISEDNRNLTLSATVETSVNLNNISVVLVSK